MSSGQCPPGFVWSEKLNKCMKSWDDIPEKKTSLAEVLGLPEGNNNQSNKEVKPEAKNEAKAESKPETKLEVKSEEFIAIGKVDGVEVKVKVNDPNYVCYGDRCGWVHYSEINDIMNTLNVPRPIAEGIAKAVTRYLLRSNNLFRECVSKAYIYNKKTGEYEEDCVKEVYVEIRGEHKVEVFLVRYGEEREVHEPIAVLPRRIIEYHDLFMDNTYYLFTDDAGRLHVVIDKNEIVNELRNAGFIIERLSYEVQVAIENLTIRDSGYLMPGITEEGIIDPTQRLAELLGLSNLKTLTLDLNDYGIESLAAIHDFVMSHYPGDNKWRALANVALVLGKVVSPVVRKRNRTFIDSLIWNYGRGGEGKTTLVEYVLAPLLGITDEYNANYFVIIKGSVRSYQQFRNLISLNRLPLILDEQTERALANNAELIIEATVGSGIIGVHAAKYGLGIGAKFMSSRGVVVFTNVPFSRFLKKVQELASEFAYVRRVVVINWVHELPNFTTDELHKLYESIKPIYGAINRVWMKYRDELIKARDIFELSKKLLLALGREYAVDNEELVRVIEDYIKALDLVMQEFEGEKPQLLRNDAEEFRDAAYDFARKLGIQVRSWMDVVDALINNPSSGIELHRAKYSDEVTAIQERTLKLLGVGPNEDFTTSPRVPNSVARALQDGRVKVYVKPYALGIVPGGRRKWMNKEGIPYKGSRYYVLDLDEFLKVFYEASEEPAKEDEEQNGSA